MRSEAITVTAFVIYDATRTSRSGVLDPITVILREFGGSGQIIVECFGAAWSHWFNAIGQKTLPTFIAGCDACYLADKLLSTTCRQTWGKQYDRELHYVSDIAAAIQTHMQGGAA